MRLTCRAPILAILLCVAGCAKYTALTPEIQAGFMTDLQAGRLNLDCGEGCALRWMQDAPGIHAVDLADHYQDLATRVMQIGFGGDLAYYYLGQAAQGLGYHQAAILYYSQSLAIATGPNPLLKCSTGQGQGIDPCQGVDFLGAIPVLIQASRDAIAQQEADRLAAAAPPPPTTHHRRHHTPGTPPGTGPSAQPAAPAPDTAAASPAPPAPPDQPALLMPPPPTQ